MHLSNSPMAVLGGVCLRCVYRNHACWVCWHNAFFPAETGYWSFDKHDGWAGRGWCYAVPPVWPWWWWLPITGRVRTISPSAASNQCKSSFHLSLNSWVFLPRQTNHETHEAVVISTCWNKSDDYYQSSNVQDGMMLCYKRWNVR